jgi:hypothetical protein
MAGPSWRSSRQGGSGTQAQGSLTYGWCSRQVIATAAMYPLIVKLECLSGVFRAGLPSAPVHPFDLWPLRHGSIITFRANIISIN